MPQLLKKKRDLVVIMASTLTRRNAEISLRALSLGAADYIPKPEAARDADSSASFRRELIDKIRSLGAAAARARSVASAGLPSRSTLPPHAAPSAAAQADTRRPRRCGRLRCRRRARC